MSRTSSQPGFPSSTPGRLRSRTSRQEGRNAPAVRGLLKGSWLHPARLFESLTSSFVAGCAPRSPPARLPPSLRGLEVPTNRSDAVAPTEEHGSVGARVTRRLLCRRVRFRQRFSRQYLWALRGVVHQARHDHSRLLMSSGTAASYTSALEWFTLVRSLSISERRSSDHTSTTRSRGRPRAAVPGRLPVGVGWTGGMCR